MGKTTNTTSAPIRRRFRRGGPGGQIVQMILDGEVWTCFDEATGQLLAKISRRDWDAYNYTFLDCIF